MKTLKMGPAIFPSVDEDRHYFLMPEFTEKNRDQHGSTKQKKLYRKKLNEALDGLNDRFRALLGI